MKNIAKIICITMALMVFGSSYAANISELEVVDTNTLHVSMEEVKMGTTEIIWEVKVLNDMKVAFAMQNEEDETSSSVTLTLDGELQENTEYSLLTVFGADGSIDFKTSDTIEWVEIINSDSDEIGQSIDSITLVDKKTIEVVYMEELEAGGDFEFKLLSDMEVASVGPVDEATISVNLVDRVVASQDYILMVLALQDALAQDVELEEWIFDFSSPSEVSAPSDMRTVEVSDESEPTVEETTQLEGDELDVELNAAFKDIDSPDESVELLDAEGIDRMVEDAVRAEEEAKEAATQESTVESVAMSATATPETGAETWVLIMLTLFINTFYYFSRRKS